MESCCCWARPQSDQKPPQTFFSLDSPVKVLHTNCSIEVLPPFPDECFQGLLDQMIDDMDAGEVDISDRVLLQGYESSGNFPSPTCAVDSFLDELLKNTTTCTHTHTCNPPGPYAAVHTHTCYHTHTQVLASEEEGNPNTGPHPAKSKRPSGNKEAVRKYREKKKARTAYLEEEVRKLRMVNQQLVRKLQGQAVLEGEVVRLRSVLVDLRSKIDGELGTCPFQKPCDTMTVLRERDSSVESAGGTIKPQRLMDLPCFHPLASLSHQESPMRYGQVKADGGVNGIV